MNNLWEFKLILCNYKIVDYFEVDYMVDVKFFFKEWIWIFCVW